MYTISLGTTHTLTCPCAGPHQAWHLTGDVYAKAPGDKPWISEMYGYSFGSAKAGVRHTHDEVSMLYPGYLPSGAAAALAMNGAAV